MKPLTNYPMPGFGNIVKNIISGGTGQLLEGANKIIDNLTTSTEEKEAAKLALLQEVNRHSEIQEQEITKRMDIELKEKEAELKDVADARANNTAIQQSDKASWLSKNIAYLIDIMLALVWSTLTLYITAKFIKVINDGADMTAVLSIYATVTAVFMNSVQYHRGTTASSQRKDKMMEVMVNRKAA